MDFHFSEEQDAVRDLAREILEAEATLERIEEAERSGEFVVRDIWAKMAGANLLGLAVPEKLGGMGFGALELCVLLEEVGRALAPIPAFATLALAGWPLARFGSEVQQRRWLAPMASGEAVLSAALVDSASQDASAPATRASRAGQDWRLSGAKFRVPAARAADRILVPARVEAGVGFFLLDPHARGVSLRPQRLSHGEFVFDLSLDEVPVCADEALPLSPEQGVAAAGWLHDWGLVSVCALQLGVSGRALELTANYVKEREQFGQPIGAFQAVQHRCADAYVDLGALRWTMWRAAWKLAADQDATREAMVAKFWAAEAGRRIAASAQHLHAGHGVDRDYVLHRYFTFSKTLELCFGSATPQLAQLGREMARCGPQEQE